MSQFKKKALTFAITLAIGLGFGYGLRGNNVVEKIVEKKVEVVKRDVVTVVKEVVRPDGTKETVTTVVDKTKEDRSSDKLTLNEKSRMWKANVGADYNPLRPYEGIGYSFGVERRLLKNIWVGLRGETSGNIGASIGIEF